MARKRKGRRQGMLSGLKRKAGSAIGSVIQILGLSHGAISAVRNVISGGDPALLPRDLLYYYTGVDSMNKGAVDWGQTTASAVIVIGSWGLGKAIKYVANH